MQILKYELKKIFYKKSSIISLILLAACLGLMLFFSMSSIFYTDKNGNNIKGIKAIKLVKIAKMKWNGYLTIGKVRNVLEENERINSDSKYSHMKEDDIKLSNMQYSRKQGFEDIRDLINYSYEKPNFYDYNLIDKLNPKVANTFYLNRISQLKNSLSGKDGDNLTKNEKEYLLTSAKTLTTPLKYSYADGFRKLFEESISINFALAFVICILIAPVFSIEYQTGSDSILLSTEHGKKKGIIYKLIAGFLSTSLVYLITSALVYGFIFMIFGFDGWNCPIQASMEGWKSFYHITNLQAFCMVLLLGYLGCLFISALAMFLSSKVKSSFSTIVFLILFIFIPSTLGKQMFKGGLFDKLLNLFPHQLLLGWPLITSYTLYDIAGKVITPFKLLPILYVVLAIILLPFTYRSFKKHQVA
ncbi:ABC transporter permease [Clostridium hydrogenum]|uniref:ABC transporter permease n=1 Tax=Clostridium hydrogenum TaxID=2855764 RepID=UPI001F401C33|nr:ABC transporter permease subunit [Clostridium hydrogenum]